MADKTIKVDEEVHRVLERKKMEYEVDTFNQVLRHELGLISEPKIEQLAAFLHDDLKQTAQEIADTIRDIGDFEERVRENPSEEIIEFVGPSGRVISTIRFNEHSFGVKYLGQGQKMKDCGMGSFSTLDEEPRYGLHRQSSNGTTPEDVIENVENKVSGSYRKWEN